jgi:hypothetical protein
MWNDPNTPDDQTYNFDPVQPEVSDKKPASSSSGAFKEPILGMTPAQRFVVALFLLMVVCLLGVLALVVFGKFTLF